MAPGTPSHLGGMREFRANKVGRSFFDGLWFDEFGDDIRDPAAVFDVAVEVEAG